MDATPQGQLEDSPTDHRCRLWALLNIVPYSFSLTRLNVAAKELSHIIQCTPKIATSLTNVLDSPGSPTRPLEKPTMTVKTDAQESRVLLIPTPSDDPRDPLNWPVSKKLLVCFALCFALFTGFSAPFNGQIQLAQQAQLYGKTTVEITYFVSTTRSPSRNQCLTRCYSSRIRRLRGVCCRAVGSGILCPRRLVELQRSCGNYYTISSYYSFLTVFS